MATTTLSTEAALAVLQSRIDKMEQVMESVANSLAVITKVQLQNEAMQLSITQLRADVSKINDEMPILKLIAKTAIAGATVLIAGAFYAILKVAGVHTP